MLAFSRIFQVYHHYESIVKKEGRLMPELTDYRKKPISETTFYVYDDLRAWQKGIKDHIYRYDTIEEALAKYKELPDTMTSALGISYQEVHEVDMVQTNRGESFLVADCLHIDFTKEVPDFELYLDAVKKELNLKWKSEYELFGKDLSGILIPIDEGFIDASYLKNRTIRMKRDLIPVSAISEFFNEGIGWQNFDDTVRAAKVIYGNAEEYRKPRISKVAVDYLYTDPDTKRTYNGNMDLDIAGYRYFLHQSMEQMKENIATKIDSAHIKQTNCNLQGKKQRGAKEYDYER